MPTPAFKLAMPLNIVNDSAGSQVDLETFRLLFKNKPEVGSIPIYISIRETSEGYDLKAINVTLMFEDNMLVIPRKHTNVSEI